MGGQRTRVGTFLRYCGKVTCFTSRRFRSGGGGEFSPIGFSVNYYESEQESYPYFDPLQYPLLDNTKQHRPKQHHKKVLNFLQKISLQNTGLN